MDVWIGLGFAGGVADSGTGSCTGGGDDGGMCAHTGAVGDRTSGLGVIHDMSYEGGDGDGDGAYSAVGEEDEDGEGEDDVDGERVGTKVSPGVGAGDPVGGFLSALAALKSSVAACKATLHREGGAEGDSAVSGRDLASRPLDVLATLANAHLTR